MFIQFKILILKIKLQNLYLLVLTTFFNIFHMVRSSRFYGMRKLYLKLLQISVEQMAGKF